MAHGSRLSAMEHLVVLMLENRSFDHLLGFLYTNQNNVAPSGQPYEGLTGTESNPDKQGQPVKVSQILPTDAHPYFTPGANPGEGYKPTNAQLFGSITAPSPPTATMDGFVTNFADTLVQRTQQAQHSPPGHRPTIIPGTTDGDIMRCHTPQSLPVLAALARGYAVCDHWFSPAPTETMPNRAFACAATSQGHMDDHTHTFTCPSIFGLLSKNNLDWKVYGNVSDPLTRGNFPDIHSASANHFGVFTDFQAAARTGALTTFTFLEPSWSATGSSEHPVDDVAKGEQLIQQVYRTLHDSPAWEKTLLVITYDEHGGCYDHVPPPATATPPGDGTAGEFGFDFARFGVRVPAVLVSPLIDQGIVFRAPANAAPLDHTSVLKTLEERWSLPSLTKRDAAATGLGDVLTRTAPRTDDVLAHVAAPAAAAVNPSAGEISHLQEIHADLVARQLVPGARELYRPLPTEATPEAYEEFIRAHTE
ncbi:alkaline phosphatase family protein [Streptomyces gilvosporeus]|uniref:Phosphoesterase n=1 Tax=Streptomyces gilvosporeus TaxID=553510 RepID=A0A1V0TZW8_9ACTN|nr:alkaline phosphatase family protein [Streptomyces gilvosporeus]ARF58451.1 phosphoesterase [Streptomyces gilvosporeus]